MGADARRTAIRASLLASLVMLAGKLTAYLITHSTAIFSDALESCVHGAATALAAFSLWYAARPADSGHPYGHGRIAYFSAGFEGALVFAAAVAVVYGGIAGLVRGPRLQWLGVGLLISGCLALINIVLGLALLRVGRRHNALILVANGKHVLSDVWTTAAAIVGLGLVMITGRPWLDPLAALIIGAGIMLSGVSLVRRAFGGLMDQVDERTADRLIGVLEGQVSGGAISAFHQLRCRMMNDEIWVDVHLLVPGDLSTRDAHTRVSRLEEGIRREFPYSKVRVTSHVEPIDHEAAHPGGHGGVADPLATTPGAAP